MIKWIQVVTHKKVPSLVQTNTFKLVVLVVATLHHVCSTCLENY